MRYGVNLKARHASVRESFVLRLQSDSEHELTDPLTSLCCLGFPLDPICGAHFFVFRWCAGLTQRDVLFFPVCAGGFCTSQAVQADFLPLSHFPCFPQPFDIQEFGSMRLRYLLPALRTQTVLFDVRSRRQTFSNMSCGSETSPFPVCQITTSRGKHFELGVESASRQTSVERVACDACAFCVPFPCLCQVER